MFLDGGMKPWREPQCLQSFFVCVCVALKVHPSKDYFVAAEKGKQPDIIVYEYPSLQLYRILRGNWDPRDVVRLSPVADFSVFDRLSLAVFRRHRAGVQLCGF